MACGACCDDACGADNGTDLKLSPFGDAATRWRASWRTQNGPHAVVGVVAALAARSLSRSVGGRSFRSASSRHRATATRTRGTLHALLSCRIARLRCNLY